MTHIIAKHYLKEIKVSLKDFQFNCHIDSEKHILTLNNQLNFIIPYEVFDDLVEMEHEILH